MDKTKTEDICEVKRPAVMPDDVSKRLDIFASESAGITRSQVQKMIGNGLILVNGTKESPGYKIRTADSIEITIEEPAEAVLIPESLPLHILYMDEYLAVVDKPARIVVYPAAGHASGTLMNALAYYAPKLASIGGGLRPGVVHRLDKDTSGVMVVALDDAAYYNLTDQFKNRTIQRKYLAVVSGALKEKSGEINLSIGRSASDRKKMSTQTGHGKEAVTRWKVLRKLNKSTMIEARLGTGRTHQIRVHFAAIGHPLLGDTTYGKITSIETGAKRVFIPRQMLHAEMLGFTHPISGQIMEFSSPVPDDMKDCIENLA
jgi:23S rRNA pseudouridine1911/1915/1917 synthase